MWSRVYSAVWAWGIPPPPFSFFPLVQRRGVALFHKSGKRVVTTRMIMETVWLYRAVGKCVIVWLPPEAEALQKCRAEIGQPTLIASKSKSAFFFFFFFFFVPLWFLSSCVRIRGCCRAATAKHAGPPCASIVQLSRLLVCARAKTFLELGGWGPFLSPPFNVFPGQIFHHLSFSVKAHFEKKRKKELQFQLAALGSPLPVCSFRRGRGR